MTDRSFSPQTTEGRLRRLEEMARANGWAPEPGPGRPMRSRRRRIVTMLMTVVLIVALPMVALASDTFTDVPNSNIFHNNINNLYGSRVTSGCGGTNFCPKAEVTREQMAAFLNRGLGRAGAQTSTLSTPAETRTVAVLDSLTIRTGDVPGGTVFLVVSGSVSATVNASGVCPCGLSIWPEVGGTPDPGAFAHETISDIGAPLLGAGSWRSGSASFTTVFEVASGTTHTVELNMDLSRQTATAVGTSYQLTAYYVPFGPMGNDQPAAAGGSAGGAESPLVPSGAE